MVAVALMAMSGSALATDARIAALGGDVAPYICDDANVFSWYATLPSYSNLLMIGMSNNFNYGNPVEAYYGLSYAIGEDGSWGTLAIGLMENTQGPNTEAWTAWNIWGYWNDVDIFTESLTNVFALMYGYQMEGMSFGLFFSRAAEVSMYESDFGTKYEENEGMAYTTIGLGFRMDIGENMVADVAFDYTGAGYLYEETSGTDLEADPGSAMSFRGRLFYDWKENIQLVLPYFSFETKDFAYSPVDEFYSDEAYGFKSTAFKLGIGANLNVNEDNMILFAIEPFAFWKASPSGYTDGYDEEWEVAVLTMPKFILGLESDLTDWLTFRTGCSKSLTAWGYTWEDDDNSFEYATNKDWDTFSWNIGLGFHFGDFDIDCVLNKDVPFSMGYWMTGYQEQSASNGTPVGMISAIYHF